MGMRKNADLRHFHIDFTFQRLKLQPLFIQSADITEQSFYKTHISFTTELAITDTSSLVLDCILKSSCYCVHPLYIQLIK